jgi:hypothetical protein
MNETAYYQILALTLPIRVRIEELLSQMRAFCPEEVKDFFVSDVVQQDGARSYLAIWAFSDSFIMEAPLTPEGVVRFDLVRHRGNVGQLDVSMKDFQWNSPPSEVSRLTVRARFDNELETNLQAAGPNCEQLKQVCVQYLQRGY